MMCMPAKKPSWLSASAQPGNGAALPKDGANLIVFTRSSLHTMTLHSTSTPPYRSWAQRGRDPPARSFPTPLIEMAQADTDAATGALEAVDETLSDTDSGFDEAPDSTASLRSSIFDYEEEYGRSYQAFRRGKYVMPNDDREQERMDIHYHSVRLAFGNQHFFAPIERPIAILDVGTGTGIWAMDVADDYPEARVIGVDLSPIQPTAVPPNLQFQIMDADEDWDFSERFDLIHTRLMNGFSIKSWPFFYQQAFAHMRPGGWVENQGSILKSSHA